jgi:hypothetical protein
MVDKFIKTLEQFSDFITPIIGQGQTTFLSVVEDNKY